MLKTEQILNAKFTPVSKGTYSADEVDSFLKTVAQSYEQSLNENKELIKKISILADKIESYRNDEEAIKLSLLDAHRMAETVNKNAKDKADAVVADAESKSKIILDGANRQSNILVEEAREKAKEIVDNARTAVASLTDRAQKETDLAINSAREKSAEIISKAEEEGKKIIGSSKEAYEFYSSELERIKAETENYKKVISDICNNQLSLINTIPEITVNSENQAETIEEIIEENEIVEEPAEAAVEVEAEDEPEASEESDAVEEEVVFVPEAVEVEETEEEPEVSDEEIIEDKEEKVIEISEDTDDLFSLIDDMDFDDNFIASNIDEIVPAAVETIKEESNDEALEEIEKDIEELNDDDLFEGFEVNLDEIDDESEDEDISSLFDSLFDD